MIGAQGSGNREDQGRVVQVPAGKEILAGHPGSEEARNRSSTRGGKRVASAARASDRFSSRDEEVRRNGDDVSVPKAFVSSARVASVAADIARREWQRKGRVPLHTLRENIDYRFLRSAHYVRQARREVLDLQKGSRQQLIIGYDL